MKRLFILTICLCLLLAGCGEKEASGPKWEPLRASADVKPYAQQAIKIIDQYLYFEISKDEAERQFREVRLRFADLDIRYEIDSVNYDVYSAVDSLCIYADDFTDIDFHMYRDILSFQLGEEVSGKVYAPKKKRVGFDDDETLIANHLNIDQFPFSSSYIHLLSGNSSPSLSLYFDAMNGVKVSNLRVYVEKIETNAKHKNIKLSDISLYYSYYDQWVFGISVDLQSDNSNRISLYYAHADQIIGEYDNITDALRIAEAYLGKYAP